METLGKNCSSCKHFYIEDEIYFDDNAPQCPKCKTANGGIWNETKASKYSLFRIHEK